MPGARPLVSVILPTYNRGYVLKRAVDSVLAQTYSNLELIVIDDGSTDNTQELLASYSDPRLKVVVPGKNGGPAAARNRGLEVARGDFIAFQAAVDVVVVAGDLHDGALAHLDEAHVARRHAGLDQHGGAQRHDLHHRRAAAHHAAQRGDADVLDDAVHRRAQHGALHRVLAHHLLLVQRGQLVFLAG